MVSGTTGKNLDILLAIICKDENVDKNLFFSNERYNYRITNASNVVHYKGNGNRTESDSYEISNKASINRLVNELEGFKIVITFGNKAKQSLFLCQKDLSCAKIISVRHIGMQSINKIKTDEMRHPINNPKKNKKRGRENTKKG